MSDSVDRELVIDALDGATRCAGLLLARSFRWRARRSGAMALAGPRRDVLRPLFDCTCQRHAGLGGGAFSHEDGR